MQKRETVVDFFRRHDRPGDDHTPFHVFDIETFAREIALPHYHRTFYKITLATQSKGILSYADKDILINDNVLVFANPMIPYSWQRHSGIEKGYFCLFTKDFFGHRINDDRTPAERHPNISRNGFSTKQDHCFWTRIGTSPT